MLQSLTVKNFVIVQHAHVEFKQGMSVITGETGAGKSILIEALAIVLGQRAPARLIQQDKKLSVSLGFDLKNNPLAKKWLASHQLDSEDTCILQRTIETSARSHAYINGMPVTLNQLKELGSILADIVGQNSHQLLLQQKRHLEILDLHCGNQAAMSELYKLWEQWATLSKQIEEYQTRREEIVNQIDLLRYQVKELEEFSPQHDEFEKIEKEHQRLSQIEQLMEQAKQAYSTLYETDEYNVYTQVSQITGKLENFALADDNLAQAKAELEIAMECIQNASREINTCLQKSPVSDDEFHEIEKRLSNYIELSRKYQTPPAQLAEYYQKLHQELEQMENPEFDIETMQQERTARAKEYNSLAQKIRQQRRQAAITLEQEINKLLHHLNMPTARFTVHFSEYSGEPRSNGLDDVEFMAQTNTGQPLAPVKKVASGGELSRISLALQVAFAKNHPITTLVFDEVDAGIGGKTAEMVGKLLRQLSQKAQVLCITHLPQIATFADHHYFVEKQSDASTTTVTVKQLSDGKERDQEIARMLAGSQITERTLAHAQEMLAAANSVTSPSSNTTDSN